MAIGVGVANTILLVTFAEKIRQQGNPSDLAARDAALKRLRPILMTSLAMIAGMLPMAVGLGEGGNQTAPLARAVIGGLLASISVVLIVIPIIFSLLQKKSKTASASIHAEDIEASKI